MNECIGILGRLFGHNFESMIIKYKAPERPLPNFNGVNIGGFINTLADKEYKIICLRCGAGNAINK